LVPLLAALNAMPSQAGVPIEERRRRAAEAREKGSPYQDLMETPPEVADIHEERVPVGDGSETIGVRIYRSQGALDHGAPGALVVYHGGGWIGGSIGDSDSRSRTIAAETEVVVVNVDYRLAPEHQFPTPVEDAYDALTWTAAQAERLGFDARSLGVEGESAGGNLAGAVALMARDRGGPTLSLQILEIPALDLTLASPSVEKYGRGHILDKDELHWCVGVYLGEHDARDPRASPIWADSVAGLPPAVILTSECDPICDDGRRYAERLAGAEVPVVFKEFAGHVHGSHSLTAFLPSARDWRSVVVESVREHLVSGGQRPHAALATEAN
jgi:acetyl esterase